MTFRKSEKNNYSILSESCNFLKKKADFMGLLLWGLLFIGCFLLISF